MSERGKTAERGVEQDIKTLQAMALQAESLDRRGEGPAFPCEGHYGMTLRDWFAGQALGAVYEDTGAGTPYAHIAKVAYNMADAMLAERQKTQGPGE